MNAIWLRIRAWTRTSGATIVWSALLIGVVAGVVMGLATGVRRTASAPDRYTEQVGGDYDLGLQQPFGSPLAEAIRGIDGVRSVESLTFVAAFPVLPDGTLVFEPTPWAGDATFGGARIIEGRFPQPGAAVEFTVNADVAQMLDAELGTVFPIQAYSPQQAAQNAFADPPAGAALEAELVGVTESPSEYSDALPTIVFSPNLLAQYGDDIATVVTVTGVRLEPGVAPDAVLSEIYALPGGSEAFTVPPEIVPRAARRGVDVQVAGLWIVVAVAAVAAALVVLQIARRIVGSNASERSVLSALGWTSRDVASEVAAKAAIVTTVAAPVAVALAATLSARFPLGVQRLLEPDPGVRLDALVSLVGFAVVLVLIAVGGLVAGRRRMPSPAGRGGFAALAERVGAGAPLTVGASLASDGSTSSHGGLRSFAMASAAVAVMVGSGTVAVALRDVDSEPARWGANYQYTVGNSFVPATDDLVTPLSNNPDVGALTAATFDSITILGQDFPVFAFEIVRGDIGPAVLSGRLPRSPDEIGLGAETMRTLDVQIGDDVTALSSDGTEVVLRVVGRTASAESAGAGAAMTFAGLTALRPSATKNLILVEVSDAAAPGAAERLSEITEAPYYAVPTSVQGLRRAASAPFILLLVLAALAIAALSYRMVMSLRLRRNDLIVLRALGAEGKQLRRAVHWHVTLLVAGAVLIGIPLGLVIARWVVLRLASTIGILPAAPIPLLGLLAGVVVGVVSANLIAAIPARRAAKVRTDQALRDVAAR